MTAEHARAERAQLLNAKRVLDLIGQVMAQRRLAKANQAES